jgi:hypothetical protein
MSYSIELVVEGRPLAGALYNRVPAHLLGRGLPLAMQLERTGQRLLGRIDRALGLWPDPEPCMEILTGELAIDVRSSLLILQLGGANTRVPNDEHLAVVGRVEVDLGWLDGLPDRVTGELRRRSV